MKKLDPRVVRTRQMLRDALVVTVLEKGYDATNIQDITERAGLRRATFYLHYRDKEELLLSMMHDVVDDLLEQMKTAPTDILTLDAQKASDEMTFVHVQANANLYRAILSGQGAAQITRGVRDYLAARIREHHLAAQPEIKPSIPIEVLANYMAAVKLHMIIWWLENGMPYTPEQMADMCSRLLHGGTAGVLDGKPFASDFSTQWTNA